MQLPVECCIYKGEKTFAARLIAKQVQRESRDLCRLCLRNRNSCRRPFYPGPRAASSTFILHTHTHTMHAHEPTAPTFTLYILFLSPSNFIYDSHLSLPFICIIYTPHTILFQAFALITRYLRPVTVNDPILYI